MLKIKQKEKFPSELRMDIVSNNWVVIATGRAKRPETFKRKKTDRKQIPPKNCPFCKIETQEKPTLIFSNGKKITGNKKVPKNWTTIVIPNKYPAFIKTGALDEKIEGSLYKTMNAVGFHEVVATRDHKKQIADFKTAQVKEIFDVYQERYLGIMNEKFVNHISIFHNHGFAAGASITHPHSQIITTPLIDKDLRTAFSTAQIYFQKHNKCIYCEMNEWEKKAKRRIVFENEDFIAICPFASKTAFEVIISPQKHLSYFERITEKEKWSLAEAFQIVIKKIYKGLNDPDYNFYLHTASCDGKNYDYYHWHWTILPKTAISAGFEIGTMMEISTIEPEKAAEYLRKQ
ncbi:galactose-1-phosphate uridylyltransferase [Patescibacteria group bacterium]|nr:galactose-1-phosphate uridylyltransferase [Patescibacteria group bacterium]MBU4367713.1 galactose-1-phosphate uridylyltransferase [Patescibacteria group bacterium]MBU4461837.1 galactose-1-phosphate uridylyltransferase [Patescibacteria group bacterium]MCG2700032.1 galactose-1-phosphate uridylyltransferase [Candidatus Parcubacteria bacterium]